MKHNQKVVDFLFETAKQSDRIYTVRTIAAICHRDLSRPIISSNSHKTHPLQARFRKNDYANHLHAEIHATAKAMKFLDLDDLLKADLYIIRAKYSETNTWIYGLAKPCEGCMKCIEEFGFKNVFYSVEPDIVCLHA